MGLGEVDGSISVSKGEEGGRELGGEGEEEKEGSEGGAARGGSISCSSSSSKSAIVAVPSSCSFPFPSSSLVKVGCGCCGCCGCWDCCGCCGCCGCCCCCCWGLLRSKGDKVGFGCVWC